MYFDRCYDPGVARRTYYELLGIPTGASVEHIKDSYRLLTRKTAATQIAYETLTAADTRTQYDAWLLEPKSELEPAIDLVGDSKWGRRGRERCSCGDLLKMDEDWYCMECGLRLDYWVVFDMFGGYVIHDNQMPIVTEAYGQQYWKVPFGSLYGPFPKEEAEAVLGEKNKLRNR